MIVEGDQRLEHLEPGQHAEVAVEAAARADGVDVRAGHHGRQRGIAARAGWRPRCRWRRSATSSPRSRIQRHDQVAAVAVGVGERQPGAAALAVGSVHGADLAERLDPRHQPVDVDPHRSPSPLHVSVRSRRRRSRPAPRRRRHGGLEQRRPVLGGGDRRVADVAVGAEVVRQPAEADLAAEAHVAVGGQLLGHVARGRRHVDQVGREVQHQRRLVGAAVDRPCRAPPAPTHRLGRAARRDGRGTSAARAPAGPRGWPRPAAPSCRRGR